MGCSNNAFAGGAIFGSVGVKFTYPAVVTLESEATPFASAAAGAVPFGSNSSGFAGYPAFPAGGSGLWEYNQGGMVNADYGGLPWDVNQGGLGHRAKAICCKKDMGRFHVSNPAVQATAPIMSDTAEIKFTHILGGIGFVPNAAGWAAAASAGGGDAHSNTKFQKMVCAPFLEIGYRISESLDVLFTFSWSNVSNEKKSSSSGTGDFTISGFNDTFAFVSSANVPWPAAFTSSDLLDANTYIFPLGRVAFPGSAALPPVQRAFFQVQVPNLAATQFCHDRLDFTVHEWRLAGRSWYSMAPLSRWGFSYGAMGAHVPYTSFRHRVLVSNQDVSSGGIQIVNAGDVVQDVAATTNGNSWLFGLFGGMTAEVAFSRLFFNANLGYDFYLTRLSSDNFTVNLSGFSSSLSMGGAF